MRVLYDEGWGLNGLNFIMCYLLRFFDIPVPIAGAQSDVVSIVENRLSLQA